MLSPALAAALDATSLSPAPDRPSPETCWVEIASGPDAPPRQPAMQAAARLRESGTAVDLLQAVDPPFWSTTEITVGETVVATTLRWLESRA
jgi:hypothetical protein